MEDAHIAKHQLTNKSHSIFGVFDGHGGTISATQEPKFQHLCKENSSVNWKKTPITKKVTLNKP